MKANSFRYLVKEGTVNVWLNRLMSLASIGVLTTCLLLIGFSCLITVNINRIINYLGDQNEIVFFIKDDAPQEEVDQMLGELQADERLFDIVYLTRDEALADYAKTMDEEAAALLEGLEGDENPCLANFRFKIRDLSQTSALVAELEASPLKWKVNAPTDVADTMTNIKDMINVFGVALIVVLTIVSLVIIANTIRATVFSRRKEINIMKYVGATNNFIRIPFFVEGIVIGLISAVLAFLLVWGGYSLLASYIEENASTWIHQLLSGLLKFKEVAWPLFGGFAAAGVIVGTVGCTFSVRNHLKV